MRWRGIKSCKERLQLDEYGRINCLIFDYWGLYKDRKDMRSEFLASWQII